ncbi:alpha,alpha-trehalase TreF [Chitinophaga rhizophila]|uniref:Alpha,alpha-trehalase TreF n=1 Tax=Chitinophaga rhizophila TaxID=2866212 RepID=A0ABS7G5W0_9BACT|nr:alpha,alpha-trehalase TreF [Chitinophaga rhizophila]MBW8682786.1 alpha,alpha-trehalase TreF [Chitinophaga rhizophila]
MNGRLLLIAGAIAGIMSCKQQDQVVVKERSPRQEFPGLFEQVQHARIFADSKTLADCAPKTSPADVLQAYAKEKTAPGFDLSKFVHAHFYVPAAATSGYVTDSTQDVTAHIESLWNVLTRMPDTINARGSLIALPEAYVVPGGRFREVYYWDSYFTMLGLKESGRTDLIESMIKNFAYLIRTYGFIPNGNRTYYLTRSQPPYFSLMVQLLVEAKETHKQEILTHYLDVLEKEYQFWMKKPAQGKTDGHLVVLKDSAILNRYWDRGDWPREESWREDIATAEKSPRHTAVYRELRTGAESGWDYSCRWFEDGKSLETIHITDIIPVDLNCLLYNLEMTLADAYSMKGNTVKSLQYESAASVRRDAILRYCWDAKSGFFRDYDFRKDKMTPVLHLGGMYPFFFGIAREGQADSMTTVLTKEFLYPGGLVSTPVETGEQWDAPNGWAPLQWMAISGLLTYHKDSLAGEIAGRWSKQNIRVFRQTGKLLEKYNVKDTTLAGGGGEYPNQDGFGWTNGVLLKILRMQQQGLLKNGKNIDTL